MERNRCFSSVYLLKRVHIQAFIEIRRVAKSGSQDRFEDQAEVQHVVARDKRRVCQRVNDEPVDLRHALLKEGISTCLTDDQISPLNDDNGDEESRVTRVFECFTLLVRLSDGEGSNRI